MQKCYTPNWSEKVFMIKKVIFDINGEDIVATFYKKEFQKANQKKFRIEKLIKRKKAINYVLNEKDTIIHLTVGLIKKA